MNTFSRFILLLIISHFPLFGQQERSYKWYTSDNGYLPQNSVKSIVPGKNGFIWLTTEDGLVRYNGQQFKVYNSDNIKGLKSNRMMFIKKNYHQNGNYVSNDLGQILMIEQNPRLYSKNGKDIHPLKEIGRLLGNNVKISASFFKFHRCYEVLIKDKAFQFYPDSIRYYSVTDQKRLNSYPHKLSLDSEFFILNNTLYLKSQKKYFEVTPQKLIPLSIDRQTKEAGIIYINNAIDQAFLYADKKLYYLTADKNGLHQKEVLRDFDVVQHKICALYYDYQLNILYLGSQTKGFLIIRPEFFRSYADPENPMTYTNVLFDSTSVLTGTGQIISYKGTIRHLKSPLETDNLFSVIDNNGDLWTLDAHNLHRYKKNTDYSVSDRWTLQQYFMTAIYKDKKGLLWIGATDSETYKKGQLYVINPNASRPKLNYFTDLSLAPNSIYRVGEFDLLIGSFSGLYHMNLNTKRITHNNVIADSFVRGIYSSDQENIWVYSYNNGLFLIRGQKGTIHFPLDKNKYLRTAHCVVEDQQGYIWIPTNKGLFQVLRQGLFDYADKKKDKIYYHYYDKSSGFLTNEFNGGCYPCATNLPNGYIALPSFEGITYFDSKKVAPILPTHPIYINEAKIDDRSVVFKDTLVVDRNFSRMVIDFDSPFYGNPENLNIEVKMDGADNQYWTKTDENYTITYTTLAPGKYKLTARKLNGFDSKYDYKTITIIVPPAFWQTFWFKCLLVVALLLLLYYGFQQRTKYIRRQNLLLEQKISRRTAELKSTITTLTRTKADLSEQIYSHKKLIGSITHDIKSPLKYMALTGKHLYENPDHDTPDFQENIKTIYTSSFELFHFVNNLLEYSKIYLNKGKLQHKTFNLHHLIDEKIKLFDPIAKSKRNQLENTVSEHIFLHLNKHLFTIIIHNLLDNAIKNTTNGTICFSAIMDQETIRITITDTGIGMTSGMVQYYESLADKMKTEKYGKQFTKGIGFQIIIELLNLIDGQIKIESELDRGTQITISIRHKS